MKIRDYWNRVVGMVTRAINPRNYMGFWYNRSPAGVRVTPEDAFKVSVFWACIEAIAKALAPSPWNVFTRLPNGDRDLVESDPLNRIFNLRFNEDMTAMAGKEALLIAALSWGNGYAEIVRQNGKVVALYPITPDRVTPERNEEGNLVYRVQNDDGGVVYLDAADMYHLKGPGITGLIGDNVVSKAVHSLGLAIAAERYAETYFGNNTEIGGMLETPNKLDDIAYNRLKDQWNGRHAGPNRAFTPAILDNGLKWTSTSTKAQDAQLIQARQFQVEEICRWFGVPPHKIQSLQRATNNNIEHQGIEFARDALTPWKKRMEEEADYKLFSARGPTRFTLIDIAWTLQGDFTSRANGYQVMRNIGAFSVNDIMRMEGRNTIGPEGDLRIVNSASITLEQLEANGQQETEPAPAADEQELGSESAPPAPAGTALVQFRNSNQAVVLDAFRMTFQSIFERLEGRRSNRLADLRRRAKPDDDVETAMEAFADSQMEFLNSAIALPCVSMKRASGNSDVLSKAHNLGVEVLHGEIAADVAALDLVSSCFGATV